MGWTVTSLAAKAAGAWGLRGSWAKPYAASHAAGLAQRGPRRDGDTVFARAYARRLATYSAADRKALEAARSEMVTDAAVLERAIAAGATVTAAAALAAAWEKLPETAKDVVRAPAGTGIGSVRLGSVKAVQVDQTTCGAAVMAMMLMTGDPLVAAWVMTGRVFGDHLPPEVMAVTLEDDNPRTIDDRWAALQRALHRATTSRALGPFPWPASLGTPPWRVDNVTRFAGVRFRGAILDDTDPTLMEAAIAHASAALRDGIPVPLYTGGDSSAGLDTVVPRHVVLLVGRIDDGFAVYEPGSGRVLPVSDERLVGGGPKEPALGQWTRACWMILPKQRLKPS
ncbi:hypothetical protein ON058_04460 [Demequina sp. B12]|uniref:hypothetical protein n=1 Tax=Demequina sp. B12 TaxID=2992757 RepID=UPI00237AA17B|nr:hypothetical protein [Demequina sp. B12]MDE0572665.1 hypothetical protein [Demequina sp. B12]